MMQTEFQFLELIQVALGRKVCLTNTPTEKEWYQIYNIAEKQSMVGICFAGIERLYSQQQIPPMDLLMDWLGQAEYIKTRNEEVDELCSDLHRRLADDDFQSCILKGQSVASLYKVHAGSSDIDLCELRTSGDIDAWVVPSAKEKSEETHVQKVIEWARKTGTMYYYDYHHADLSLFPSTEIELHYRATLSRNLIRNSRLQKWLFNEGGKHVDYQQDLGFATPDYIFNVILTLNHNFWHLMYEGVGMRQFLDLYFVMVSEDSREKQTEALSLIKYFKLLPFTEACMWLMKEVFKLDDCYLLCEPNPESGKFLLNEIMKAGNFGHHDERLKDNRYKTSRIGLMWAWMKHTSRLFEYYPADVLWTPIGVLRISLWRRWHYKDEKILKNIQ